MTERQSGAPNSGNEQEAVSPSQAFLDRVLAETTPEVGSLSEVPEAQDVGGVAIEGAQQPAAVPLGTDAERTIELPRVAVDPEAEGFSNQGILGPVHPARSVQSPQAPPRVPRWRQPTEHEGGPVGPDTGWWLEF